MEFNEFDDIKRYIKDYWKQIIRSTPSEIDQDTLLPLPHQYLVPAKDRMFQEMYYWDSFFMALGLVNTPNEGLIVGLVENMAHLIKTYGLIPNANRGYYLSRSQPPLFTRMIWRAFDYKQRQGHDDSLRFLAKMMRYAESEHDHVWMGEAQPHHRLVNPADGLSRYFDTNYLHNMACCESGWDHSPRCDERWLHHLPVDLNTILYIREKDFAQADARLGRPWRSRMWNQRAEARKEMMAKLMWDDEKKFFFDVDFNQKSWMKAYGNDTPDVELTAEQKPGHESEAGHEARTSRYKRNPVLSLAGFFPLWAKVATEAQAKAMVERWLPEFEKEGGLVTTLEHDVHGNVVPKANEQDETFQWMYPNGWAPLQWIVVRGLEQYDFHKEARRIREKWCRTCATVFQKSGSLWEKYNVVEVGAPPGLGVYDEETAKHPFGNVSGFGWTNAVFMDFEHTLNPPNVPSS